MSSFHVLFVSWSCFVLLSGYAAPAACKYLLCFNVLCFFASHVNTVSHSESLLTNTVYITCSSLFFHRSGDAEVGCREAEPAAGPEGVCLMRWYNLGGKGRAMGLPYSRFKEPQAQGPNNLSQASLSGPLYTPHTFPNHTPSPHTISLTSPALHPH